MHPLQPIACVLFDLDGTLLDTARDMAQALNRLREEQELPALPFERIRSEVSHGSIAMIRLGFDLTPEDPLFSILRQRFLDLYSFNLANETTLFPGMDSTLAHLGIQGIPWGVVTNKPGWLTDPLLRKLNLFERAACVVSGDTVSKRKPDPEPLLHACQIVGIDPRHCLYVGDAERDIQAGKGAGMTTLVARFGYIGAHDTPEDWGADGLIDAPEDLLAWLQQVTEARPFKSGYRS